MRSNKTFDELAVGEEASITRVVSRDDLFVFAHASGSLNPANLPGVVGDHDAAPAAPAMWVGSLFSAVLGNLLPGPGTLYLSQTLHFYSRAHVGDALKVSVRVEELRPPMTVVLKTRVNRGEELIADGMAEVRAPATRQLIDEAATSELTLQRHVHVDRLLGACRRICRRCRLLLSPPRKRTR